MAADSLVLSVRVSLRKMLNFHLLLVLYFLLGCQINAEKKNPAGSFSGAPMHAKYAVVTFSGLAHEKDTKHINISDFALGYPNEHIDWLLRV